MLISTITTTPRKPHRKLTSSLETHSQGKQINGKQENWKQFKNKTQTLDKTLCTLSNFKRDQKNQRNYHQREEEEIPN